jgi:aquaporin Z
MSGARPALRQHWPEYLIEAAGLGVFMLAAGICVMLLEQPGAPLHRAIVSPDLRRTLIGVAMGLTAIAIIYSPWGRQSGAHLNPAVTLTFLRLGKVAPADAIFYVAAQFAGGIAGTTLLSALLGGRFTLPPISAVATLPGRPGEFVALAAEVAMAFVMMTTVLTANASARLMRWTGVCAGALVAFYIAIEAPLSGMSLNPARSIASAVPSGLWHGI